MAVAEAQSERQIKKSNRLVLFFILAIPVLVIVISTMVYYLADNRVIELGTVNRGVLVSPPLSIADIDFNETSGHDFVFSQSTPIWTLLVLYRGLCDDDCEQMLYLTRQVHTSLAKYHNKIRRVMVIASGSLAPAELTDLLVRYPDLKIVEAPDDQLLARINDTGIDLSDPGFFWVDPSGWLMMRYSTASIEQDVLSALGKDVIKDAKRLIK